MPTTASSCGFISSSSSVLVSAFSSASPPTEFKSHRVLLITLDPGSVGSSGRPAESGEKESDRDRETDRRRQRDR